MWGENQIIMIFSICIVIGLSGSCQTAFSQANSTGLFTSNNNASSDTLYNNTRIMENTSGMIDDALEALKHSFDSFFRAN